MGKRQERDWKKQVGVERNEREREREKKEKQKS